MVNLDKHPAVYWYFLCQCVFTLLVYFHLVHWVWCSRSAALILTWELQPFLVDRISQSFCSQRHKYLTAAQNPSASCGLTDDVAEIGQRCCKSIEKVIPQNVGEVLDWTRATVKLMKLDMLSRGSSGSVLEQAYLIFYCIPLHIHDTYTRVTYYATSILPEAAAGGTIIPIGAAALKSQSVHYWLHLLH